MVPIYWTGLTVKNALYARGRLSIRGLTRPVVSVGSLSAGGAGKTPVVLMLAELLAAHGVGVDVLSRGYGRGSGAVEEVDAAGDAERFGDEPLEMARRGVRVFVGADRWAAGRLAEESAKADSSAALRNDKQQELGNDNKAGVHLLDDGFQHRRLQRELDVVLLTLEDARDWLLPAGNLREPLWSLGRADVVVIREDEADELAGLVPAAVETWVVRRELMLPVERPRSPLVFCGIARPEGFLAMLGAAGCAAAGEVVFGDHHVYGAEDFARLVEAAQRAGADGFCTTAKDAVKIPAAARAQLEAIGPVVVAELRVSLVDKDKAWARLRGVLGAGFA
jgi:tetraacyldisaccharide 4'-kinase